MPNERPRNHLADPLGIASMVGELQRLLSAKAVNKYASENSYQAIRGQLFSNPVARKLMPKFVTDSPDLEAFRGFIGRRFKTYGERRQFLSKSFAPLLAKFGPATSVRKMRSGTDRPTIPPLERGNGLRGNARHVFVVHGHDEASKHEVARFLERLDLNPIILHEQADRGRTIIEKFLDHSRVGYAVVLLTADDLGGSKGSPTQKPRARQNVILELGYFIGALGRGKVCALRAEGVEVPSDLAGVLYVDLDAGGAWKLRIAREMKAAGLDLDLNRVVET